MPVLGYLLDFQLDNKLASHSLSMRLRTWIHQVIVTIIIIVFFKFSWHFTHVASTHLTTHSSPAQFNPRGSTLPLTIISSSPLCPSLLLVLFDISRCPFWCFLGPPIVFHSGPFLARCHAHWPFMMFAFSFIYIYHTASHPHFYISGCIHYYVFSGDLAMLIYFL